MNEIVTGDCLKVMQELQPKADLIFTSPPYPGQKGDGRTAGEWLDWFLIFAAVARRHGLADNGVMCVNVAFKRTEEGWYDCSLLERVPAIMRAAGFNMIDVYPWIKPNPAPNGPLTYCDVPAWEPVFVATKAKKPGDYTFREYREPYKAKSINGNGKVYTTRTNEADPHPEGARQPNVVIASSSGDQGRPKAKGQSFPLSLAERFILQYSEPGDLVMDTFSGVGTTCKAAQRNGRDWLGIEIVESEAEKARQWLAEPYQYYLEPLIP